MTAAASPRVNLMPPEIAEAARFRQIQAALVGAVALAVVLVGFLYWHARSGLSGARSELDQAKQQQTSLQAQLASLASVQQTYADIQSKQAMLAQAMGTEVRWSFLLNDLSFRMPSNVWLTSMTVTETATAPTPATPATPGAPAPATAAAAAAPVPIGTIVFNGVGLKHDDVAAWLDAMAKEKTFLDPTFSASSESAIGTRKVVDFSGEVTLNSLALSNRFAAPTASTTPAAGVTP
jgi:Tfp pilus assembly protein PilN